MSEGMKFIRSAILCLALFSCREKKEEQPQLADTTVGTVAPQTKGVTLESKEGGFRVRLPEGFTNPDAASQEVTTDAGKIMLHLYTTSAADGSSFVISYNDYPEFAFVKSVGKMMDDIRDGALKNLNATLERQRDFRFEEYPARSLDFSLVSDGGKGFGRMQYFIVKPRLYQMVYIAFDSAHRDMAEVKGAFSSFELLK